MYFMLDVSTLETQFYALAIKSATMACKLKLSYHTLCLANVE